MIEVIYCRQRKHFKLLQDTDYLKDFGTCLEERGESTTAGSMICFPDEMFCDYGEKVVENKAITHQCIGGGACDYGR